MFFFFFCVGTTKKTVTRGGRGGGGNLSIIRRPADGRGMGKIPGKQVPCGRGSLVCSMRYWNHQVAEQRSFHILWCPSNTKHWKSIDTSAWMPDDLRANSCDKNHHHHQQQQYEEEEIFQDGRHWNYALAICFFVLNFLGCGGNASTSIKRYRKETKKEEEKKINEQKKKFQNGQLENGFGWRFSLVVVVAMATALRPL